MANQRIARNFESMRSKGLIDFGQNVEEKMSQETGIFPSPTPSIAELSATRQALSIARANAKNGSLVQRQEREAITALYRNQLLQLSLYVSMAAANSAELMERSGFTLTKQRATPGIPDVVTDLNVTYTGFKGEMGMGWRPVHGALSYTVQFREEGSDNWVACTATRIKTKVSFLQSEKKYIFRVAAVGSKGLGPWSDEVARFVL